MAAKAFNVGVIGYGMSAKVFHIPFISALPEFNLYAIVQRTPSASDDAQKDHPESKVYRSAEELVNDSAVDVVVITTTPDSHFSLAKLALEAKKHGTVYSPSIKACPSGHPANRCVRYIVVVEKPFTPTTKEANELIELAKTQNKLLTVYQNRRWDADFVTASKLIKDGSLGRVVEFETHFDRHRPELNIKKAWKGKDIPGGGSIYDLGTHLIDQAVHLFGLPNEITGFITAQREISTENYEDSFTVLLHYDRLLVTAKSGVISPEENQLRFWIRGEKGSFKKYHLDPQEDQLQAGVKLDDAQYGCEPSDRHVSYSISKLTSTLGVLTTFAGGKFSSQTVRPEPPTYKEFYRSLAKALSGQGQVPVDPADSGTVIRLVELAKESSKKRSTLPVSKS
ncbi:NAD binding Rossmann fold oxidoreductase, putative [Trichophyton verrucosum HKI 0517]|uniref:NAD binding Rossmann fold oxidoreductase, putative n=1 Tax=Trichophyton verrucosum (strain HKI 0517) TaxID=663202 RepID=D4D3X8_TRIVH|nr:NAD binding Rossmann fold oxidoreductase, putative [Trichophyton verrucosum HKI 0517]EFE43406.1 NAD binding Rossmann fold oxidoreductase, putative [Trichophyton verrucosum HKI 0517]